MDPGAGRSNRLARERLSDAGGLGASQEVRTERGLRDFAAGDRLIFLRNERSMGVRNGSLGTVEDVGSGRLGVRLDDGRRVTFDVRDYAEIDHGYATTIHKAQGSTVDHAQVLASPYMDRHAAYVALSRHRRSVRLHYGAEEFLGGRALARTLGRERAKDTTLDYPDAARTSVDGPAAASDRAQDVAARRGQEPDWARPVSKERERSR